MVSKANRLTFTAVSTVLATGQAAALPPHQPPEARLPYEGTLMLAQADSENRFIDAYAASRYDYDDAALLADFWGQPTPWDAKLKIGRLLLDGQGAYVQQALQQASQRAQDPEAQRIDAFVDGPFTYDDAALLADFWGKPSPWDAKLKIGGLLLDGQSARVEAALGNARSWKAYVASRYGYNDAEALAGLWGLPSPWDAKLKIGRLLLAGDEARLQRALQAAR